MDGGGAEPQSAWGRRLVHICTTMREVKAGEGDRLATVQDLRRELPTGTERAILAQLGLKPEDLR